MVLQVLLTPEYRIIRIVVFVLQAVLRCIRPYQNLEQSRKHSSGKFCFTILNFHFVCVNGTSQDLTTHNRTLYHIMKAVIVGWLKFINLQYGVVQYLDGPSLKRTGTPSCRLTVHSNEVLILLYYYPVPVRHTGTSNATSERASEIEDTSK
jgi:hypothetical protein